MPYVSLYEFYPDIAANETRVLTILGNSHWDLPPDEYAFIELFCNEPECDCRRVFFHVESKKHGNLATIAYGWEKPEFYIKWLGDNDAVVINDLVGPCLNFGSPQSKLAIKLLQVVKDVLLKDDAYVERVKKHYRMVRNKTDSKGKVLNFPRPSHHEHDDEDADFEFDNNVVPYVNQNRDIGRNDPCPCGSGKKFKQCCLK